MILISQTLLKLITGAAEFAYPTECCGLLAGRDGNGGEVVITRVVPSRNVSKTEACDSFEVDPEVRFTLMRDLGTFDGHTAERIVGHYHSHPDHLAKPSERDIAMAYEPDLVWLITAVEAGRATATSAYLIARESGRFQQIKLRITE